MTFCLGNAIKYIWRAGLKSADPIEDLKKARWYIEREIARLEAARKPREIAKPRLVANEEARTPTPCECEAV
jgi:hypothetical protein